MADASPESLVPDTPDPVALINAWLAVEALQPQTFPNQDALLKESPAAAGRRGGPLPRAPFPFDPARGPMPWETPEGDRARLRIADDEALVWYVPLGFVRMEPAVERLITEVEPDGPEREKGSGVSVLALAAFDEAGRALPSHLLLSSFGWACGQVLAGRIDQLHRFVDIETDLRHQLGQALVELDLDGRKAPTSRQRFRDGMAAIMTALGLPADLLERPRVAIRVIGDPDGDPVEIINSFYLRDLHRVRTALEAGAGGATLAAYLGQAPPTAPLDVLGDKAVLESLVAPALTPPARWPAPRPAQLVTLQQAAVNGALRHLAEGGLLSINGPPGTGKTTLLRDVVAAVLGARADALAALDDPAAAFTPVDLVAESGHRRVLHRLPAALRGYGLVVASSNNAAVRNVSAELPLAGAVDAPDEVRYFAETARAAQGGEAECWGLIAAVLGNRKNRGEFVESAWWHPDWGLEKYLGAAAGRVEAEPPPIVVAEKPPRTRAEALERWRRARLDYRERKATVDRLLATRDQMRWALRGGAAAQQAVEDAVSAHAAACADAEAADQTRRDAAQAAARAEVALGDARRLCDGAAALRPGPIARLLNGDESWREIQARALARLDQALADQAAARAEEDAAARRSREATARAAAAETAAAGARDQRSTLRALEAECAALFADGHAGPSFWEGDHARIHTASPWADPELTQARDQLFAAVIALHRAFLDAAARPMKSNLGLMMDHLKGRRPPSGADVHLGDLWDSFFLLTPLVSTTFASFDRLMDGMGEGSLGWLIVDEAGQAAPQAATGALWRAQRALVIGDPLQIAPVSTVPQGLVRAIFASHGAHPDVWAAPRASAQTLADAASPLTATLGSGADRRRIGMPLLVHRRCQEPMFSISNQIAYDGLMVHATGGSGSVIRDALADIAPGSCWLDVVSSAPKWSPQEGEAVLALLDRLAEKDVRDPDIYLIAPFRDVADKLRAAVLRSGVLERLGVESGPKRWSETHIGTVHTFQGKEAEAVFLVLGASAEASRGSRDWAGQTPNILNVAVTRARKALYVVGRREAWRTAGVFATAAQALPVATLPVSAVAEAATPP
ncbi:DEAD/DEAH box helicase [Caulobacter sp. LARHSG274]